MEKSPKNALELLLIAVNDESVRDMLTLGSIYRSGKRDHVAIKDVKESYRWYSEAVRRGSLRARYEVGYCLSKAVGVETNERKGYILDAGAACEHRTYFVLAYLYWYVSKKKTLAFLHQAVRFSPSGYLAHLLLDSRHRAEEYSNLMTKLGFLVSF